MTHKIRAIALVALLLSAASVPACTTTHKPGVGLAAKEAPKAREVEPEAAKAEIATEHVTRTISMFYSLDMLRDNAHSAALAAVLRTYEQSVRACYASRLDTRPDLAGDVALGFSLSAATGSVQQIARLGGSLRDRQVLACMKDQISQVRFNPPYDMRGRLHYQFRVMTSVPTVTANR